MDELAGLPAGRIDLDSMQTCFGHVLGIDGHCFKSCRYHGFEVSSPPLGGFPVSGHQLAMGHLIKFSKIRSASGQPLRSQPIRYRRVARDSSRLRGRSSASKPNTNASLAHASILLS